MTGAACGDESHSDVQVHVVQQHEIEILAGEAILADAIDVRVDGRYVWALDSEAPFLTRVNIETGEVQRFGDEGSGPSELVWPVAIVPDGEQVIVWDPGARRVHRFDAEGHHVEATRLDGSWGATTRRDVRHVVEGDPFRVRRKTDGFVTAIYPGGVNRNRDLNFGFLTSTPEVEFGTRFNLGSLSQFAVRDGDALRELGPVPLWEYCDNELVVWSPAARAVQWFEAPLPASPAISVPISLPRRHLSKAAQLHHLAEMARLELGPAYEALDINFEARLQQLSGAFSNWAADVVDVRCGWSGRVWLRLKGNSEETSGAERWRLIEPTGASLEVRFPRLYRPLVFYEKAVIGVVQSAAGDALGTWPGVHLLPIPQSPHP
jgi:hypothetical protein